MTAKERCELVIDLCEYNEGRLILSLDESYEITAADVGRKEVCRMLGSRVRGEI